MTYLIFVFLGSVCNAIMDTCAHHYSFSIFSKYPNLFSKQFWDADVSWKNKYVDWDNNLRDRKTFLGVTLHVAFTDAWHLFKSIGIICFALAIVSYPGNICSWTTLFHILLIGFVWNLTFSLFYNRLLKK